MSFKNVGGIVLRRAGKVSRHTFPLEISVLIAAYNEAVVIKKNVDCLLAYMERSPFAKWEIVVVNDGSSDGTGCILDSISQQDERLRVIHLRRNFGQGRALRVGFMEARGDCIVTLDADLSYAPNYILSLFNRLEERNCDIVLASPYTKGGGVRNVPVYRHFFSHLGNWYLAKMSHYAISTSTCVVRAYRREVVESLLLTSDGMELQLEILMKSAAMGFIVAEVPAHLEWADEKVAEADLRRVSKMRILRTIRLYLMLGWLSRPALVFVLLGVMVLVPGLYMGAVLSTRVVQIAFESDAKSFVDIISASLSALFQAYTYSVVFCVSFLLVGFQLLAFSLLLLQNKFCFDETYRMLQSSALQGPRRHDPVSQARGLADKEQGY